MTLKQLEAFYLAATLGNFALAAQRVHVTQSSLSKRIAELEAYLQEPLFDRSSNRAILTESGHRLLPIAAQMLELKQQTWEVLKNAPLLSGLCRFGISELGALTWLPAFVQKVKKQYPDVLLQPHVDLGRRLEQLVVKGELDFAIIPGATESPHITAHKIGEVHHAWFASPQRIKKGTLLTAKELLAHPIIAMSEGSRSTHTFDLWAASQGLHMQRIVTSNSLVAIIGLTIADIGLSFLPQDYMTPWLKEGAVVKLHSDPALPILNYCFMHREDDRRALISLLLPLVKEVADYKSFAGRPL